MFMSYILLLATKLIVEMCGKPKFCLDSVFKNRTARKFDMCSDGFPIETACNPQFNSKVNTSNFTRIKCADKERFKTRQK